MEVESVPIEAFGNTADACFAVDDDWRITIWNEGAERLFGYRAADVIGEPCWAVVQGLRRSGRRLCSERCPVFRRASEGRLVRDYDLFARDRSGRRLALNVGVVNVGDGDRPGADSTLLLVHYARQVARTPSDDGTGPGAAAAADTAGERWKGLTTREEEILGLLARGLGTGDIARHLDISPATVRNHIQSMMGKLGVHGRIAAVAAYARHRRAESSRLTTGSGLD